MSYDIVDQLCPSCPQTFLAHLQVIQQAREEKKRQAFESLANFKEFVRQHPELDLNDEEDELPNHPWKGEVPGSGEFCEEEVNF